MGSRVPSHVSVQRFSAHGAPLPSAGSRRARFPVLKGRIEALRLPARASPLPYLFGRGVHALLLRSCSPKRSRRTWRKPSGLEQFITRRSRFRRSRPWTRAGSHRFPGDPSHAFALILDPGRAAETSPLAVSSMLPPAWQNQRPQRGKKNIEADSQGFSIRCLRFTTGVAAAHARLASGWRAAPLPGGTRTLRITPKGFRSHPSPFPGLVLSQCQIFPNNRLDSPNFSKDSFGRFVRFQGLAREKKEKKSSSKFFDPRRLRNAKFTSRISEYSTSSINPKTITHRARRALAGERLGSRAWR